MATFIDYILDAENILSNYIAQVEMAIQATQGLVEVQSNLATIQQQNATKQVVKGSVNTNAAQQKETNKNVRLQLDADTDTKVPVVYGRTVLGGKLIDAQLSQAGLQLDLCYTICMVTGNKIDGTASEIVFKNVFWNNQTVYFRDDGVTVAYLVDDEGNIDSRVDGKIQIWCYNNGVANQTYPIGGQQTGDSSGDNQAVDARNVMTGWTTNHFMTGQVFAIIKFLFDPQAGLNIKPNILFEMENSMTLPGDCLYDYMTNGVYGANISPDAIKVFAQ